MHVGKGDKSNFAAEDASESARRSATKLDLSPFPCPQPAFTYLANSIACGKREIPYSTITAVDFADRPPLGPMLAPDGKPVPPLSDGQIAINSWAAEDLGAKLGDTIRVTYFEPESTAGAVREQSVELRLAAIVRLAGAAADPDFTPEVPGVTDQLSIANWDPPFPFDARRVRKKDDVYWHDHRGTPKAFVSLATGRRLWASRFGQTTSIRISIGDVNGLSRAREGEAPAEPSVRPGPSHPRTARQEPRPPGTAPRVPAAIERIRAAIHVDPADMGFRFQPVKAQGLAASAGTTPFELLFLGFSFFLIVAAAMLVAILFRLGVDRRAAEIGILLAVGLRRGHVVRLLVAEGSVIAALGSLAGLGVGIGYATLLIAGLHTWWLAAVVTPFLQLYVTWQSLAIGYASGLVVALATIFWSARRAGRNRPRRLLAGQTGPEDIRLGRPAVWHCLTAAGKRFPRWKRCCPAAVKQWHTPRTVQAHLAWGILVAAIGLAAAATQLGEASRAASFFGAASLVLTACLMSVWVRLRSGATGPAVAIGRGNLVRLAVRNAARNPMRSTLTIGLVAAASFLIVAVSAFRIDPAGEKPNLDSGNGGFALVGQSDQPIYYDLSTPDGRAQLGFSADDERAMAGTQTIPIRVLAGDDASCLNLYRPQQPRILGVPRQFIDRGGFAWASAASPADIDPRGGALPVENPWQLLELDLGTDQDGVPRVPAVLEKTTADYSLHLSGLGADYDVRDASGRPLRLVVVGLLKASIFQGDLIISETAFLRHFPQENGHRMFLIETGPGQAADVPSVARVLERTLGDYGFVAETTSQRLAAFQAVENTYLSTFQSLGGLGLLLGTFGLAAVQLRSVLERRGELALLRATGFRRRQLAGMVILENAMLLVAGLGCGVLSAAVAVLPHFTSGRASIPWASLAGTLGLVLAAGLLAGLAAVRSALRTRLWRRSLENRNRSVRKGKREKGERAGDDPMVDAVRARTSFPLSPFPLFPFLTLFVLSGPASRAGEANDLADVFSLRGEANIMDEEHFGIVNGLATVGIPYKDVAAIDGLWAPPFVSSDFRFSVKVMDRAVSTQRYTWRPFEVEREGSVDGLRVRTTTALVPGHRGGRMTIAIENTSPQVRKFTLQLAASGTLDRTTTWEFARTASRSATQSRAVGTGLLLEQASQAIVVRPVGGTDLDAAQWTKPLTISLTPRGTWTGCVAFAIGDKAQVVETSSAIAQHPETRAAISTQAPGPEKPTCRPDETYRRRVAELFEKLPRLRSSNAALVQFYNRSLVHFLMNRWDVPEFVLRPYYGTGSVKGGCVCDYLWNFGEIWEILPLYDPAADREHIKQFLKTDMTKHFAFMPITGEAFGPWYPVNQEKIIGLIYYYVKLTGDTAFLREPVDGQERARTRHRQRHVRRRPGEAGGPDRLRAVEQPSGTAPRLSVQPRDAGPQRAPLRELPHGVATGRGGGQAGARICASGPNRFKRWSSSRRSGTRRPAGSISSTPKAARTPATRSRSSSSSASGVLDAEEEAGLLGHLNETEFLSQFGLHSMAKTDVAYDQVDIDNGGGGACTCFPPQIAERLYKAGRPRWRPRTSSGGSCGGASACRTGAIRSWPTAWTTARTRRCSVRSTASPWPSALSSACSAFRPSSTAGSRSTPIRRPGRRGSSLPA